jgi:hypothetical protein
MVVLCFASVDYWGARRGSISRTDTPSSIGAFKDAAAECRALAVPFWLMVPPVPLGYYSARSVG